jgi:hypothetical protein
MIKFFRKIRYDLMERNETGKYLKYAIGEIFLVVIGILIALQINNWNENQKTKRQETKLMEQLKSDLNSNFHELQETIDYTEKSIASTKIILEYLDHAKTVDDRLKSAFEFINMSNVFNSANTTYKYIENQGINILRNDSLRQRITEMYELDFHNIKYRDEINWDLITDDLRPLLDVSLRSSKMVSPDFTYGAILDLNSPIDMKILSKNEQFKNVIVRIQNFLLIRLFQQQKTRTSLEKLIADIDIEIKSRAL